MKNSHLIVSFLRTRTKASESQPHGLKLSGQCVWQGTSVGLGIADLFLWDSAMAESLKPKVI